MSGKRSGGRAGRALSAALCLLLAVCLCGCKPTDFFTEVVISPFSDVVDEDNPDKSTINSPDATDESDQLAALDWTDESEQTETVNTLVVYSSLPNTNMETHHSLFDLSPLIAGIEASDGVRLVYDADAEEDNQNSGSSEEEPDEPLESTSTGGQDSSEDAADNPSSQEAASQAASEDGTATEGESGGEAGETGTLGTQGSTASGGTSGGTSGGGDDDGSEDGSGSGSDSTDGTQEDPYAGYDGTVTTYNPNDAFMQVQHADSVAVMGTDVAVLAQAIGGEGAVCALTQNAYWGTSSDTTASCFREVFAASGDIDTADFEANRILWLDDGSSSSDLVSIGKLVEVCGQGGVIVYDQNLGDQSTLFSDEQRRELYAADIMLVPVDTSTVQGLLDAAEVIGEALSESPCANDASAYADAYEDAVSSIVRGVAATHGGTLASSSNDGGYGVSTTYSTCPVKSSAYFAVYCHLATDIDMNLSSSEDSGMDLSYGVLFAKSNVGNTPLFFWMQAAGVVGNYTADDGSDQLRILWPQHNVLYLTLNSSRSGAYTKWLSGNQGRNAVGGQILSASQVKDNGAGYGLGSNEVPYLVVSAASGMTAQEVRSTIADSVDSYRDEGVVSLYAAYPYTSGFTPYIPILGSYSNLGYSSVGGTNGARSESPFYAAENPLSGDQVVRANPCGLLGSWTEGSMESVLEAVWLADLYSHSPEGCDYDPINDMSQFSCNIGGYECTTMAEAVQAFYQVFYRLDASNAETCYNAAVPDQFEDL